MNTRRLFALCTVLLMLFAFAGCESKPAMENMTSAAMDSYFPAETMAPSAGKPELSLGNTPAQNVSPVNQKLIRTIRLEAETEDMDALLEAVTARVAELEGYIEERNIYNGSNYGGGYSRYANLTIRIPADRLDQFVEHVSDASNITSNQESTEDVTLDYIATGSRTLALETEHQRLLELLAKAENMEDLLLIESRLTSIRAELEEVKSQLRLFDNLVSYGTVRLSIDEVRQYTVIEEEPETVWQRIGTGFMKSLKGLGNGITEIFVFLVVALPYLLVIALAVTALVLILRSKRRKKVKKPIVTDMDPPEN